MRATELKSVLERGATLVLSDGVDTVTSDKRGVKPLIELLESGRDYSGFVAADKVVGRAAAFLYVLLGVKELYAGVISKGALVVCERFGITVSYETTTDKIINRAGDGVCPMEQVTEGIADPENAYAAVKQKLASLGKGNK